MKFALIDNIKTTATKGTKGLCPNCGSELVAKCGEFKVHHWAHRGVQNCDPWWENETEWHRNWKSAFPNEWQEVIFTDEKTGEKHIADIRSSNGLVAEFQHSHLDPSERVKRETFYKKMIWVVDGTRLKRDLPRFLKGTKNFRPTNSPGHFLVDFIEECFPADWIGSTKPVFFDFKGNEIISDSNDLRNYLFYLYPKSNIRESLVAKVPRQPFIQGIINGELFSENQDPQKQLTRTINTLEMPKKSSPYVFDRGRFVKRRRL